MADLEAIIQNAVTEASDPEAIIDSPAEETTSEALPDAVGDTSAAEVADTAAGTVVPDAQVVEKDALTLDLEGEGIKSPEVGRDNRIPYTRVKKITENLQKKWTTQHEATVAPIKTELASAKAELTKIDQVNKLIEEDPDRYISMLAVLNPKYKKFLGVPDAPAAPAVTAPTHDAADPQPQPDGQFPDGTTGYTSEGFEKLLAWRDRQTEKRVLAKAQADFDKRLGPIESERKAAQAYQEKIPQVRAQIERAKATWGKLFEDDYALDGKSEILAYMNANPQVPFDQAVAKVLVPRIQADRNAIRESVIKELNSRKPAATNPGTAAKTPVAASGARDMESVIRDSIRAAGLQ